MATEAVKKVCEAEQKASEIISAANTGAKKLIADAKRNGREMIDTEVEKARREVAAMLERAEEASSSAAMEIMAKAEGECEKLRILAGGRMEQAAAFIIERVVNG